MPRSRPRNKLLKEPKNQEPNDEQTKLAACFIGLSFFGTFPRLYCGWFPREFSMSSEPQSLDPYRSPSLPEGPYAGRPLAGRPGKLTALCVLCIVLGALGLMNSLFGTFGAVAGPKMQAWFQPKASPGTPPEMQQAQDKFNDETLAVQNKYFVSIVGFLTFRFVAALLLLLGGLRCLNLHEPGRKLLMTACAVAMVFELLHAIHQSLVNMEMMTAINSFLEGMTRAIPEGKGAPPGFGNTMQSMARGMIIAGIVLSYLLVLAKVVLYLFGLIYLQTARIKALFKP